MLIIFIVDEFNRGDEGGCSKASESFCITLFLIASVAACKFLNKLFIAYV